jgi:hypothetical protein
MLERAFDKLLPTGDESNEQPTTLLGATRPNETIN